MRDGKKTTHDGIKVEFVGSIGILSLDPLVSIVADSFFLVFRTLLRSWSSSRISVVIPRTSGTWGDAPSSDVRLQLQKCREAIRKLSWD